MSVVTEFFTGVRMLLRGFGYWRQRPGLMALGLVPAAIAFALLAAALVPLAMNLGLLSEVVTPFADGWIVGWRTALRAAVGFVIFVAALALSAAVFSALTLVIGDPFYQRIWRAVEEDLGTPHPLGDGSFWTTVSEAIRLILTGVLVAVLVLLIGFVPVVGGALSAILGVVLTGRVLARELTGRAFDARDVAGTARGAALQNSRARVLGFGVATQLCFLVPLGAVLTMPAAVAGATMLARSVLDRAPVVAATPTAPESSGQFRQLSGQNVAETDHSMRETGESPDA